jgi:hypothetical protein
MALDNRVAFRISNARLTSAGYGYPENIDTLVIHFYNSMVQPAGRVFPKPDLKAACPKVAEWPNDRVAHDPRLSKAAARCEMGNAHNLAEEPKMSSDRFPLNLTEAFERDANVLKCE